jgi:acyl transferase domain-containing protein
MNIDEILTALQERRIDPGEAEAMLSALQAERDRDLSQAPDGDAPSPHLLLQRDISSGSARLFVSVFTGQEVFLEDHVIQGRKVLPAVVYLEMARLAAEKELARAGRGAVLQTGVEEMLVLKHVTWEQPIAVGKQPANVYFAFQSHAEGGIQYEIYTSSSAKAESEAAKIVHSRGIALMQVAAVVPPLDLVDLRLRCTGETLSGKSCYEIFEALGVMYGPAFRTLQNVSAGIDEDGRRFALAHFALPASAFGTRGDYVLHPSLMDAAFQAPIGLMLGAGSDTAASRPRIPFALEEVHIVRACPVEGVVVVREASESTGRVQKFDIDLSDLSGQVCVRLKRFSARVIEDAPRRPDIRTMLLAARLEADPLVGHTVHITGNERWIVFCEIRRNGYVEAFEAAIRGVQCVEFPLSQGELAERFERHAQQLLVLIQRILGQRATGKRLVQLLVPAENEGWLFSGLAGMLRTVQLEDPRVLVQVIGIEAKTSPQELCHLVEQNAARPEDTLVRYLCGIRHVERLVAIETGLPSTSLN